MAADTGTATEREAQMASERIVILLAIGLVALVPGLVILGTADRSGNTGGFVVGALVLAAGAVVLLIGAVAKGVELGIRAAGRR
ncbi:MAG: hypothetical protein ACRDO2_14920 [Nocardioidaceae bacterium]